MSGIVHAAQGVSFATPLDFEPLTGKPSLPADVTITVDANCNRPGPEVNCFLGNAPDSTDNTPYFSEIITEGVAQGGQSWYHIIIGDPGSDFAQEMYIKRGGMGSVDLIDGTLRRCIGICDSYSGGAWADRNALMSGLLDLASLGGNGLDPLAYDARFTGNGSGYPESVIMRTIIVDQGIRQDFIKAELASKPVIDQDVTNADFTMKTHIDMSNSNYQQDMIRGQVDIVQRFHVPALAMAADFDSRRDVDPFASHVTAGQYTFVANTTELAWRDYLGQLNTTDCTDPARRQAINDAMRPLINADWCQQTTIASDIGGSYHYRQGQGFDPRQVDWKAFRDPVQNPFAAAKTSY